MNNDLLLVTDLDGTLIGSDAGLRQFNAIIDVKKNTSKTVVVHSTGRSLAKYLLLANEKELIQPDILICSVGTEIYFDVNSAPDAGWIDKISINWDTDRIRSISGKILQEFTLQKETEQRPTKVCYFGRAEIDFKEQQVLLDSALRKEGYETSSIFSYSKENNVTYVDIIPAKADKGNAMRYIQNQLNYNAQNTVACGDSGNDVALYRNGSAKGVIVANATDELLNWYALNQNENVYLTKEKYAMGVVDGLKHFGYV